MMDCKKEMALRRIMIVLAGLGIFLSLYLLKEHWAPSGSTFCDLSATVSCDIVNKSSYAEIFGIPVSLLGALYYFGVLMVALFPNRLAKRVAEDDKKFFWQLFAGYMLLGFFFSLYLTAIEAFVLKVWCPLCVASAIIVVLLLAIAGLLARYQEETI